MFIRSFICGMAFLGTIVAVSGCSWLGRHATTAVVPLSPSTVSVDVLREDMWTAGGPVVIVPFTPGPKAEAGAEVDHLSLVIVKGFTEAFAAHPSVFTLINGQDVDSARFVIEGHVQEFDPGGSKFLGVGKKDTVLKIKGELRERRSGEVVALIFGYRLSKDPKAVDRMAYELGRAIGEKVGH